MDKENPPAHELVEPVYVGNKEGACSCGTVIYGPSSTEVVTKWHEHAKELPTRTPLFKEGT